MVSKYDKCFRCEYYLHEYEKSLCPRHDRWLQAFSEDDPDIMEDAIIECDFVERVRAPKTWWSKKEILRVCKIGGATYATIKLMQSIPLEDLKAILLKYVGQEPRGRFTEIWEKPSNEWQEVRRTAMYTIRWEQIEEWNKATQRICATCSHLHYLGEGEWASVYTCDLNPPWAMWESTTQEKWCNEWEMRELKKGCIKKRV